MPLRGGKEYLKKVFPKETRPFNMILLPERGQQYKVTIDFDHASKEWRKNKITLGNGCLNIKKH